MRVRLLVPALACLAAVPLITAAEPSVKFDGYVDTIYSDNEVTTSPVAPGAEKLAQYSGFSYLAKLGTTLNISDKVSAKIDITNNNNSYTDNGLYIRQAYGVWQATPEVAFKSGRFIDCVGWSAPYAPDLYRVNAGIVPTLYGIDSAVGADVTYTKDALTLEASVANGFFGEGHGETGQPAVQKSHAYAYFLDAAYALPNKKGTIDAEFVYDVDAVSAVAPLSYGTGTAQGGNGYHAGLNATLTPIDPLTIGLEAIYQQVQKAHDAIAGVEAQKNVGLLGEVNYKIPNAPWGAQVTGSAQYVKRTNIALAKGTDEKQIEGAIALLTNPAGTRNFGVNAEIGYTKTTDESTGVAAVDTKTWAFTLEALYVFK